MMGVLYILLLVLGGQPALAEQKAEHGGRRSPVVEVFERSRDAVVNISTTRIIRMRSLGLTSPFDDIFDFDFLRPRDRKVQSIGSGVVIHPSGYIVTNAHVVSQAADVHVTFADGHTELARIIAADADHDLAVLKIDPPRPLPCLPLGRSDDIMVGETVVAIGNPFGFQHTVTAGIVSALDRELAFGNDLIYRGLIQTDASINPGNSGGPLLNVNAELIGINTAIRGDAQNIGFAIPANRLWELLPGMLDIERRQRVRFGLRVEGARAEVTAVRPDSPAAAAGLKPRDRVVRVDGQPVRDSIDYYVRLLEKTPGQEIQLAVQRQDKVVQATVPLQEIPIPDGAALAQRLLGVQLRPVPERTRSLFDLPPDVGLLVEDLDPGGPADQAGVRPGDLILRLDRGTTASLEDVGLALEGVRPGQRVVVEGLRLHTDPAFFWTVSIRTRP